MKDIELNKCSESLSFCSFFDGGDWSLDARVSCFRDIWQG